MTTKKGIIKRLKDIDLALDQNLSIVRARKLKQ